MHIRSLSRQRHKIPQEIQKKLEIRKLNRIVQDNNYLVYSQDGYHSLHIRLTVAVARAKENAAHIVDLRK